MSYRGSRGRGGRGRGGGGRGFGRDSPKVQDVPERDEVDDETMGLSYYSEKSFVVYGEITRSHKDKLYELGGKYNKALQGGAGYIFPNTYYEEVQDFVNAVNEGQVEPEGEPEPEPEPEQKITIPRRTVTSLVKTVPTRTAAAAASRPGVVGASKLVPTKPIVAPTRKVVAPTPTRTPTRTAPAPTRTAPTRTAPAPTRTAPALSRGPPRPPKPTLQPTSGNLLPISAEQANLEVPENELAIQTVTWNIEVPTVGTLVCAQLPDLNINYKVVGVFGPNDTDIIDTIFVKQLEESADAEPSILQICNGKWQARGMIEEHTIVFGGLCEEEGEGGEGGGGEGGGEGEGEEGGGKGEGGGEGGEGGEGGGGEGGEGQGELGQPPVLISEDGTRA